MNENIDLIKILKDCPQGTKLYSTIFGEVKYVGCNSSYIIVAKEDKYYYFTSQGAFTLPEASNSYGECILFPSKEQRDWSKFTAPWLKKESDTIALLEKQGKKSDDKIEPKFKAGDWVTIKQ